jgi:hypothetical protein
MHVEALQVHAAGLCGVSVLMTLGLLVSSYVTEAYMYYEPIAHIIHYKERCQQGILSPISFIIYTPQGKIK